MRKHFGKILLFVLVAIISISAVGCGGLNKKQGKENTLQITYYRGGYNTEWLDNMAIAFQAANPGIKVDVTSTPTYDKITDQIDGGVYQGDLIINITNNTSPSIRKGIYLDLTDVLDSTPSEEETLTIRQKLDTVIDASIFEGKCYQIPWQIGRTGILYNKTSLDLIFPSGNYELPVTTNQMFDLLDDIKSTNNGWGFVHTNELGGDYYSYLRDTLIVQYMGYEEYKNYCAGYYTNEQGEVVFASNYDDLANKWNDARLSALNVCEKIVLAENGYRPTSCKTMDFMKAQAYFWGVTSERDYKPTAFMVNADWYYNEIGYLEEAKAADIRMMRMPINSDLVDVLDTVNTEEQLVECVKYIDSVIDGSQIQRPSYLSDDDYEKLYEARRMCWACNAQLTMSIPKNSYQIDLAKNFMRFMASEEGSLICSDAMYGLSTPFSETAVNQNKFTNYTRSINQSTKSAIYITYLPTKMSIYGGNKIFVYNSFAYDLDMGKGSQYILDQFNKSQRDNWNTWKTAAGLQ